MALGSFCLMEGDMRQPIRELTDQEIEWAAQYAERVKKNAGNEIRAALAWARQSWPRMLAFEEPIDETERR